MSDIKTALQAEIEKMESACDEIPFGLDEEDEQCLWVMREAIKQLAQREAQIAALEENLNSCLITVAKYSGPDAAPPAPVVVQVDENGNPDGFISWYERKFSGQAYKGSSHVSDCDDAYRAGIHAAGGSVEDE